MIGRRGAGPASILHFRRVGARVPLSNPRQTISMLQVPIIQQSGPPGILREMSQTISRRQAITALAAAGALRAQAGSYRVIDPHVHVWKADPKYPYAKELTRPPDKDATPEMLLALMKQAGVERTVIIQYIGYRWDNRYVADTLKKYPQYFRGVCRVDPESPAAPDDLSRLTAEQGFHGVRISPSGDARGDWIRGPLMPPLWQRCD